MTKKPLISIIIPTLNRIEFITECIKSIKNQKYRNYEIILIDDGSQESFRKIKGLCDVFIKNLINMGPAFSRNLGALKSKGKILVFLDSDTKLLTESLLKLPEIFNSDSFIGAIGGSGPPDNLGKDVKYISGKSYNSFGQSHRSYYYPPQYKQSNKIFDCSHVASAFLAIRKDIFEKVGGFDPYWYYGGEDRDICLRIKDSGYRVVVSLDTRVIHYIALQGNAIRASNNYQRYMQDKFLQVEIKRNGAFGGIKWMIGNYKNILRPSSFFFIKQLLSHKRLTKRKEVNFLANSMINKYYNEKIFEHLNKTLPFLIEYPIHTPKKLTVFVTKRCNAACQHCFLKTVRHKTKEISKEAIIKIANSLSKAARISLTGGEPFLRKDLGEIIDQLMNLALVEAIAVTSNGSLPEKIDTICRKVTNTHKKPFHIQISLDGLENTHNLIRNIKDGFSKAIETISRLNMIKKENNNFSYIIAITLMKQNMFEIEELVDYLQNLRYPSKISIIRGNSFSTFGVPKDVLDFEYEPNVNSNINTKKARKIIENITNKHPKYFDDFQNRKLKIMLNTIDYKKRLIPCYAGYEDLVIYSDGNISLCEQVKPFGNLDEWNWDLLKAWNSTMAMENRVKLTHCSCIHGCNINTSIREQNKSKFLG